MQFNGELVRLQGCVQTGLLQATAGLASVTSAGTSRECTRQVDGTCRVAPSIVMQPAAVTHPPASALRVVTGSVPAAPAQLGAKCTQEERQISQAEVSLTGQGSQAAGYRHLHTHAVLLCVLPPEPARACDQCMCGCRWVNQLDPAIKRSPFSEAEVASTAHAARELMPPHLTACNAARLCTLFHRCNALKSAFPPGLQKRQANMRHGTAGLSDEETPKSRMRFGRCCALADLWLAAQIRILRQKQAELGNSWTQIARCLPGRTDNAVKNFW